MSDMQIKYVPLGNNNQAISMLTMAESEQAQVETRLFGQNGIVQMQTANLEADADQKQIQDTAANQRAQSGAALAGAIVGGIATVGLTFVAGRASGKASTEEAAAPPPRVGITAENEVIGAAKPVVKPGAPEELDMDILHGSEKAPAAPGAPGSNPAGNAGAPSPEADAVRQGNIQRLRAQAQKYTSWAAFVPQLLNSFISSIGGLVGANSLDDAAGQTAVKDSAAAAVSLQGATGSGFTAGAANAIAGVKDAQQLLASYFQAMSALSRAG